MIKLKNISTKPPKNADKSELKDQTKDYVERLGELQRLLRAERKHSVLVILQGMDASGKMVRSTKFSVIVVIMM